MDKPRLTKSALECPRCGEKLPYVNAKTNSGKTLRVWRRLCGGCALVVVDTGVFSREFEDWSPADEAKAVDWRGGCLVPER